MRCLVVDCGVDATGKMVVCSPHWTYLSEQLRQEVIEVHNELSRQQRIGNPRRATRDAWRELRGRVADELVTARAALEQAAGHPVPAGGIAWRRTSREIERRDAVPTVDDVTPDDDAAEVLRVGDEILPPGTVGRRP